MRLPVKTDFFSENPFIESGDWRLHRRPSLDTWTPRSWVVHGHPESHLFGAILMDTPTFVRAGRDSVFDWLCEVD